MGQVKIEIKKIEDGKKRRITYGKRLEGMMNKAHEISTLCDLDLAVIIFSPVGEFGHVHYCREDRIEQVIARFADLSQNEKMRAKYTKFENVKPLNEVECEEEVGLEGLNLGEQQLEVQVIRKQLEFFKKENAFYAAEISSLREQLNCCTEQNDFLTRKGSFFSNDEFVTGMSIPDLKLIEEELEQAYDDVRDQRMKLMKREAQFSDRTQGVDQELLDNDQPMLPNNQIMQGVDQAVPGDNGPPMLPNYQEPLGGYAEGSRPLPAGGPAMSHELRGTNHLLTEAGEAPLGFYSFPASDWPWIRNEPGYFPPEWNINAPGLNVASSSEGPRFECT